jgi:hypothetical protein
MRVVAPMGALMALAAFVYGGYLFVARVHALTGHPLIGRDHHRRSVLTLHSSAPSMIFHGIMGEYLARVYEEV